MLTFPPDFSFVVQIVSFGILWFGLKRLLFDPVLQVLEAREKRTTGALHAAEEMKAATADAAAEHERRMQEVRQALSAEAGLARTATQGEEQQIVAAARTDANAELTRLRESLSRQVAAARPAVTAEAQNLATRMFERVVGRSLG